MKNVRNVTTEDVRVGYSDGTYDDELAGTEFDLWLVTERNRVAELAIKKERKRIIANILDRVEDLNSCTKNDNCNELAELIYSYIPEWIEEK